MVRTVTWDGGSAVVHGEGTEVLVPWAEACHVVWPNLTVAYQADNPDPWGIQADPEVDEWLDCTIEPPLEVPSEYIRYFG